MYVGGSEAGGGKSGNSTGAVCELKCIKFKSPICELGFYESRTFTIMTACITLHNIKILACD